MEQLLIILGGIGLAILLIIYAIYSYGILVYYFYYWFIIPIFTTLPHLTVLQSIGISLFISLFGHNSSSPEYEGKDIKKKKNYAYIIKPWFILLIGYLFKTYWLH